MPLPIAEAPLPLLYAIDTFIFAAAKMPYAMPLLLAATALQARVCCHDIITQQPPVAGHYAMPLRCLCCHAAIYRKLHARCRYAEVADAAFFAITLRRQSYFCLLRYADTPLFMPPCCYAMPADAADADALMLLPLIFR